MRKCTADRFLLLSCALSLSQMQEFPGKVQNAIFSRTVFVNERTHVGPTLNKCKVGAWRAALKSLHSLLFSAHRLVHVCWCTLGALREIAKTMRILCANHGLPRERAYLERANRALVKEGFNRDQL